jgi:Nod factor-specific ABC transporter NodJ protein
MTAGWFPIYLRELIIMRRRLGRMMASMSVSPLLYLIAFGYALGPDATVDGRDYLEFLLPGLAAMSSMTQAWAIATDINVARFYWHVFEEFQSAPISNASYVLGEVLAGVTRAILSVVVILLLGGIFGVFISYQPWFWLAVLLNALVFSGLAVALAMLVKSHADQGLLSSFVITPMAFLGGTVFPLDRLPGWAQYVVEFLPLTHASRAIRTAAHGGQPSWLSLLILAVLAAVVFIWANYCVNKARD